MSVLTCGSPLPSPSRRPPAPLLLLLFRSPLNFLVSKAHRLKVSFSCPSPVRKRFSPLLLPPSHLKESLLITLQGVRSLCRTLTRLRFVLFSLDFLALVLRSRRSRLSFPPHSFQWSTPAREQAASLIQAKISYLFSPTLESRVTLMTFTAK